MNSGHNVPPLSDEVYLHISEFWLSFQNFETEGSSLRGKKSVLCPQSLSVGGFCEGHTILRTHAKFRVTPDKMATSNGGGMEVDGAGEYFSLLSRVPPAVLTNIRANSSMRFILYDQCVFNVVICGVSTASTAGPLTYARTRQCCH